MSTSGMTVQDAVDCLTVGEMRTIERHYGKGINNLDGVDVMVAIAWAYERRRLQGQPERPDWEAFNDWTMKDLKNYFDEEPQDFDPADPDSEVGKGESPVA